VCRRGDSTTDWTFKSSDNYTYYINVCNNLVSNNPCGNDGPAYQFNPATGECFRLGLTSSEWFGDSCTPPPPPPPACSLGRATELTVEAGGRGGGAEQISTRRARRASW
jgi:hypothetical protein